MKTAVEWLIDHLNLDETSPNYNKLTIEKAKEMEKNDTDNKAIHFGEWLTNKHTGVLITLYERFEEEHYKSE